VVVSCTKKKKKEVVVSKRKTFKYGRYPKW
jgi:hypothetical protein